MYIHIDQYICIHVCIHIYTYAYECIYTHMYIYIYVYIRISGVTHSSESCPKWEWVKSQLLLRRLGAGHESCHMYIGHVAHANKSCHARERVTSRMRMSHVTHVFASCHKYCCSGLFAGHESCSTCGCVMSHTWMRHVIHVDESCHTCEWVMLRMWKSHVIHMDDSCHTCQCVMSHMVLRWTLCGLWVMSRMQVSRVTRVRMSHYHMCEWVKSGHICEWGTHYTRSRFMSLTRMILVRYVNESYRTYEWVPHINEMSHVWIFQGTHQNCSLHTWEWAMSHMHTYIHI